MHAFSLAHQKRLRTTKPIERVKQEIKRRTLVARVFPNEASLLRLAISPSHRDLPRFEDRKNLLQHGLPQPAHDLMPAEITERKLRGPDPGLQRPSLTSL